MTIALGAAQGAFYCFLSFGFISNWVVAVCVGAKMHHKPFVLTHGLQKENFSLLPKSCLRHDIILLLLIPHFLATVESRSMKCPFSFLLHFLRSFFCVEPPEALLLLYQHYCILYILLSILVFLAYI